MATQTSHEGATVPTVTFLARIRRLNANGSGVVDDAVRAMVVVYGKQRKEFFEHLSEQLMSIAATTIIARTTRGGAVISHRAVLRRVAIAWAGRHSDSSELSHDSANHTALDTLSDADFDTQMRLIHLRGYVDVVKIDYAIEKIATDSKDQLLVLD